MKPTRSITTIVGLFIAVFITQLTHAQRRPNSEAAARRFNVAVKPIYDEISSLRGKLRNRSLNMSQAADIIKQQSRLRRKADALWSSTQADIDRGFRQLRSDITRYNSTNRQLEYESAVTGSIGDLLNNVAKNPTKESFEANKSKMSASWEKQFGSRLKPFGEKWAKQKENFFKRYKQRTGVDLNATGYSRIGKINPYTGEVYYRYYGPDGNIIAAQWKNDPQGYKKSQRDFAASRRRQIDLQTSLRRESSSLGSLKTAVQSSKSVTRQGLASLDRGVRRINFVGLWSGKDNVGNWLVLQLKSDGTTNYSWGKTSTSYRGRGTWRQTGSRITMRTNDGAWRHTSTITAQFRLQFIELSRSGRRYTNYLSRK